MIAREGDKMNVPQIEELLRKWKIIEPTETYEDMQERVINAVVENEKKFGASTNDIEYFKKEVKEMFVSNKFIPSTPILTNAGRYTNKPLTACALPPVDLRGDIERIKQIVDHYHEQGMGTGFNFDDVDDPVTMLLYLNDIAIKGLESGRQDRPVGNMGLISVDHPKIVEFAKVKDNKRKNERWIFNTSINIPSKFMDAVKKNEEFELRNGIKINANAIFDLISESAYSCGDPGLVFLERFDNDNPVPYLGKYKSLAPCGEVAMTEGETCQFAYINVSRFVTKKGIDYTSLEPCASNIVRFLDDALEQSISNYGNEKSEEIMSKKRKIGVGICGFADLLIKLGIPYDSEEASNIARDLMSFITYQTKRASVALAKTRGAFPAFYDSRNKLKQGFIFRRYGKLGSKTVSEYEWQNLDRDIQIYGIRNVTTTALPPTGRSSAIIKASASIEPLFRLELTDIVKETLDKRLSGLGYSVNQIHELYKQIQETGSGRCLPTIIRDIYKTCLEIAPEAHIEIVAQFQRFTDESIAKTVNLKNNTTPEEVKKLFMMAYDKGLKGITVYRDGSKDFQPKLNKTEVK